MVKNVIFCLEITCDYDAKCDNLEKITQLFYYAEIVSSGSSMDGWGGGGGGG